MRLVVNTAGNAALPLVVPFIQVGMSDAPTLWDAPKSCVLPMTKSC